MRVKPTQILCHICLIFEEQSNIFSGPERNTGACQAANDENENIVFKLKNSVAMLNIRQFKSIQFKMIFFCGVSPPS